MVHTLKDAAAYLRRFLAAKTPPFFGMRGSLVHVDCCIKANQTCVFPLGTSSILPPFSTPFPTPAEWLHLPFSGNDFTYGFRTQNPDAKHVSCYVAARYDYTHPDYDFIVGIRRRKSDVRQGACHPEAPREGHGPVVAWQAGPR